eukprot:CAMPEP_0179136530 /NCGR_PEP_ID=MMETSP0796-20121207/65067_1 /TAXON_ID=73915 /ORGANISM="Pyrodinium bahamense, Strain pbaha01" /LENGTH=58 /DNA_ID=CAMNT_0020835623 /DNA_START=106 /DNA_END=279 /DNA_ORIENTATION=+
MSVQRMSATFEVGRAGVDACGRNLGQPTLREDCRRQGARSRVHLRVTTCACQRCPEFG